MVNGNIKTLFYYKNWVQTLRMGAFIMGARDVSVELQVGEL